MHSDRSTTSTPGGSIRAVRRHARAGTLLSTALLAVLLSPVSASAQASTFRGPVVWRVVAEAAGLVGGTFVEGPQAPTVRGKPGFLFGLGLQRGLTEYIATGAAVRAAIQPLDIRENGGRWSGGTLTEADVVGTVSLQSRRRTTNRISLDLSGGAALLAGARDILPFNDAQTLAPLVEAGIALRRGAADDDASRRDLALLLRYSMLRLNVDGLNSAMTGGWVGRIVAGVRVSR